MKLACLIDASALRAILGKEDGRKEVLRLAKGRMGILSVQWGEVCHRSARDGVDPGDVEAVVRGTGLGVDELIVIDFTQRMGTMYARVRLSLEKHLGSTGLADFSMLAAALVLGRPLLTADSKLSWIDVGAEVIHFRPWERIARPASIPARISLR